MKCRIKKQVSQQRISPHNNSTSYSPPHLLQIAASCFLFPFIFLVYFLLILPSAHFLLKSSLSSPPRSSNWSPFSGSCSFLYTFFFVFYYTTTLCFLIPYFLFLLYMSNHSCRTSRTLFFFYYYFHFLSIYIFLHSFTSTSCCCPSSTDFPRFFFLFFFIHLAYL